MPFDPSTKVSYPDDLTLKEGLNVFKIVATTKDGKTKTYTINVTKEPSNNEIIASIKVSPKNIKFKEENHTYSINVGNSVTEISIEALPVDPSTVVTIPNDLTLKEGLNKFEVKAVTKDGRQVTYTINVTRAKKSNTTNILKDLTLSPIGIGFKEDKYTYNIEVGSDINEISINALPFDSSTKVTIPNDLTLKEGLNKFKVKAVTKDGRQVTYTINVTRAKKNAETHVLKDLTVSPVGIEFNENVSIYNIEVGANVNEVVINALPFDSSTKVTIPSDLTLKEGLNTFEVTATTKDGTTKTYIINVTKNNDEITEDGFTVKDSKNIYWSEATSVDIFENPLYDRGKIIAPESKNTYRFDINNKTDYKMKYQIEFIETNPYNINMKYKLKKNGTYLIDQYSSASELNLANIEIEINNSDTYDLEWHWISSSNDTEIGKNKNSSYSLKIDVKAESVNG